MQGRLLIWSLRHRRARSAFDAIAIAVTTAVVMVFVAMLSGMLDMATPTVAKGYSRILVVPAIVQPGTSTDGHPVALYSTLQKLDGVKLVQRKRVIFGRDASTGAAYIVTGEEDSGVELNKDFFPVDDAAVEAWKRERPLGAIVSEDTARSLHLKVGTTAEITTSAGPLTIKPVAISHGAKFPQSICVHFEYMQEATKNRDSCGYRLFTSEQDLSKVIHEINDATASTPMPAHGISAAAFDSMLARRAGAIPTVLGFLGAFLIFTTALTLANNRSISVRERRTEIATLRVIGFRRSSIIALMVGEAVLVSLIGGAIAIVACWLFFRQANIQVGNFVRVEIGPLALAAAVATAVLVPLAGALPSVLRAARVPLVVGLRDTA